MKSKSVDFRALPGQNDLFLAYLYDFERVRTFYSPCPLSTDDSVKRRVDRVLSTKRFPRRLPLPALRESNDGINESEAVMRNLGKLESTDTLAVLTGQQVGLFGGPCYSAYKAATAVQVAKYLETRGYAAVPIFWLASDDSDFEEVRSTHFLDSKGNLNDLRHPDPRKPGQQMAGTVSLNTSTIEEFEKRLSGPASRDEVIQYVKRCYRPGSSFREGYASWLAGLFGKHGLVLFDPLSARNRQQLGDFLTVALERREELLGAVLQRNRQLKENGFPVQVKVEEAETFMFWVDPPNRFKLEYRNGQYVAKGRKSLRMNKTELREVIEKEPGRIAVNVLLRPILQDYLFPTFGAVVGPSEIAYLGQVNSLGYGWDIEVAAIPRAGFTIVDRKAQRLLKKYYLEVEQVLGLDTFELAREVLRNEEGSEALAELESLRVNVSEQILRLRERLEREDPTVAQMLGGASRKILYQMEKVNRRFVLNHQQRKSSQEGHLSYLLGHLLPQNRLQERILNFNNFLLTEGLELVDDVLEKIDPGNLSHQILYL